MTWLVVLFLALVLIAAGVFATRHKADVWREEPLWQCVSLTLFGFAAVILPLGNDWVLGNKAHARYFSPGILAILLGLTQGTVFLLQQSLRSRPRQAFAAVVAAMLIVPLCANGSRSVDLRNELAAAGSSEVYRASELLYGAKAQAIIGPFWHSCAYVLARPGSRKATPDDTFSHVSQSNALKVLTLAPIAWVERDAQKLPRSKSTFGLDLVQVDETTPVIANRRLLQTLSTDRHASTSIRQFRSQTVSAGRMGRAAA